jgi:hypothetical protein
MYDPNCRHVVIRDIIIKRIPHSASVFAIINDTLISIALPGYTAEIFPGKMSQT